MADFSQAQAIVKENEGKYQNISSDSGNYTGGKIGVGSQIGTNFGISAPTLKSYLGYEPSLADMNNLKYETAVKIYKSEYWNKISGDDIKSQSIALMLYDACVNQGLGKAQQIAVEGLAELGKTITKGKVFKPEGIAMINEANQEKLFNAIKEARLAIYNASSQTQFKTEWVRRTTDIAYTAQSGMKAVGIYLLVGSILIGGAILLYVYRDKIKFLK